MARAMPKRLTLGGKSPRPLSRSCGRVPLNRVDPDTGLYDPTRRDARGAGDLPCVSFVKLGTTSGMARYAGEAAFEGAMRAFHDAKHSRYPFREEAARLPRGQSVAVIALLSALSWAAVVSLVFAVVDAL